MWRAFGLQPHRESTFTISEDPQFVDKVRDVVGLYMSPPAHALVLCVDEKSLVRALDRSLPLLPLQPGQEIHLVMDNYATHKTPAVRRWFQRHPDYHVHFTPTSVSWLNQIERFFAEITTRRVRRSAFHSVAALEQAIRRLPRRAQQETQTVRLDGRGRYDP